MTERENRPVRCVSQSAASWLCGLLVLCIPNTGWAELPSTYARVAAVVVGVGSYRHPRKWLPLKNAQHDAQNFAGVMRSFGAQVTVLAGPRATRRNIINSLDDAAATLRDTPGNAPNLLVFYFSGHGVTRTSDNSGGYLIPYDGEPDRTADWLTMATLKQKADEYRHVRHMLFVLGSCFSGALMRSSSTVLTNHELRSRHLSQGWIDDNLGKVARVAITAGRADQRIPDGAAGRGSEFGNAVVNAFSPREGSGFAVADINRDGCVSTDEWFAHVFHHGRTRFNTPFFGRIEGDNQGSVVLCRRKSGPPVPPDSGATSPDAGVPPPSPDSGLSPGDMSAPRGTLSRKRLGAYVLFGAGAVCLATMAGMYGVGIPRADEAHEKYQAATTVEDTRRYRLELDDAEKLVITGHVMAGLAVAAVGIATYALVSDLTKNRNRANAATTRTKAGVVAGPMVLGPGGGGLTVGGVF